jgi:hypothetical protein
MTIPHCQRWDRKIRTIPWFVGDVSGIFQIVLSILDFALIQTIAWLNKPSGN